MSYQLIRHKNLRFVPLDTGNHLTTIVVNQEHKTMPSKLHTSHMKANRARAEILALAFPNFKGGNINTRACPAIVIGCAGSSEGVQCSYQAVTKTGDGYKLNDLCEGARAGDVFTLNANIAIVQYAHCEGFDGWHALTLYVSPDTAFPVLV